MAVYSCRDGAGGFVSVDEAAPGEWAGQTLSCRTGTDPKGIPVYTDVTFPAADPDPEPDPDPEEPADPWGQQVADFLGQGDNPGLVALSAQHAQVVLEMARAYTRDNGFNVHGEPNEQIAAVITTATARLLANPEQLRHSIGDVQMLDTFKGWSLAETFVLNRYRRRAL